MAAWLFSGRRKPGCSDENPQVTFNPGPEGEKHFQYICPKRPVLPDAPQNVHPENEIDFLRKE